MRRAYPLMGSCFAAAAVASGLATRADAEAALVPVPETRQPTTEHKHSREIARRLKQEARQREKNA